MRPNAPDSERRLRVLHVASGGFSGATQVALDLTLNAPGHHEVALALRRKRRTPADRVARLQAQGVALHLVAGWSHLATILSLRDLFRRWQPDIVIGHGFPEHLLARWAALWAGVPHRVQVEHNVRERYTPFKRWQASRLSRHTDAFVGVSAAVAATLMGRGLARARVHTIRNGTALSSFDRSEQIDFPSREAAIIMVARFGAQKDHETLIRSLVVLRERHGLQPKLRLAGAGSVRHEQSARRLVASLGLQDQVEFLGHRGDVPELLMRHQVAALSTHYEGMGLVLAEAMAAGCAVVGTDVAAVREVLEGGKWGALPQAGSPDAWAEALARLLRDPAAAARQALAAREHAREQLSVHRMVKDWQDFLDTLVGAPPPGDAAAVGMPWLSVLMPAHNAARWLEAALSSVVTQLDEGCEIIVFDDGSSDATPQILQAARDRLQGHAAFRVITAPARVGVSAARNGLMRAAQGRWLWFLDADDELFAGAVQRLKALVHLNPEVQAVVVDHAVLRPQPSVKHHLRGEQHRRSMSAAPGLVHGPAVINGMLERGQWHAWGKVVRRDAWPEDLSFPQGRVFEDLSVMPRLMARMQRVWYLGEPMVRYRSNPGSILGTMNQDKLRDWALALGDLMDDPHFDAAWADFVSQQAVRLARACARMGQDTQWLSQWWMQARQRQPLLGRALEGWRLKPRRWVSWAQASRLGWTAAAPDHRTGSSSKDAQ